MISAMIALWRERDIGVQLEWIPLAVNRVLPFRDRSELTVRKDVQFKCHAGLYETPITTRSGQRG